MYIVKEEIGTLGSYYDLYHNEFKIKKVFIQRIKQAYNNKEYVFLLNSEGSVIKNVFKFINFSPILKTINSKEVAANALKILFSFSEIINKDLKDFNKSDVQNLSDFILGISITGNYQSFQLIRSRSNGTHNIYFDVLRNYIKFIGIENENFFEKAVVLIKNPGIGFWAHTKSTACMKYKINKSTFSIKNNTPPKYINNNEYNRIIDLLEKEKTINSLRDKIIINLMYTRGLRLGEVLGITLEDIIQYKDNSSAGILYIRNRLSDKKYQMAKTCYTPQRKEDYQSRSYTQIDYGYQTVVLPPEIMNDILEYIDLSRNIYELTDKKIENIINGSKADSVVNNNYNNNFYLFVNKNGKTLSSAGWNKRLKEIYINLGIEVDSGVRKNNLSHRFRHGFAMFLIEEEHKSIEYVQKQMRHKSIMSTLMYYNPAEQQILKDTLKIQQHMRKQMER